MSPTCRLFFAGCLATLSLVWQLGLALLPCGNLLPPWVRKQLLFTTLSYPWWDCYWLWMYRCMSLFSTPMWMQDSDSWRAVLLRERSIGGVLLALLVPSLTISVLPGCIVYHYFLVFTSAISSWACIFLSPLAKSAMSSVHVCPPQKWLITYMYVSSISSGCHYVKIGVEMGLVILGGQHFALFYSLPEFRSLYLGDQECWPE